MPRATSSLLILLDARYRTGMRIPAKKITHSELMTISSSPSDAVPSIVEQVIVIGQEKGLEPEQH
jgi:hypothetical protein